MKWCKIARNTHFYMRARGDVHWRQTVFNELNHVTAGYSFTAGCYTPLNHSWPENHCFKWFFYLHADPALRCFLLRPASLTPNHFVWGRRPSHLPYTVEQVDWVPVKVSDSPWNHHFLKTLPSSRFEPGTFHMKSITLTTCCRPIVTKVTRLLPTHCYGTEGRGWGEFLEYRVTPPPEII